MDGHEKGFSTRTTSSGSVLLLFFEFINDGLARTIIDEEEKHSGFNAKWEVVDVGTICPFWITMIFHSWIVNFPGVSKILITSGTIVVAMDL